jgi:cysteine-rich repeat protein
MPRKALISTAVAIAGVVFVVTMISQPVAPKVGDIPLPFGSSNAALQGAVAPMGQRGGIDVFEVTFSAADTSELLQEDRIYLVRVPNTADVVNVPINLAMTRRENGGDVYDVNFYGYRYGDYFATLERRDIHAPEFKDRFPGQFFASAKAKAADVDHGNALENFATDNGITFLPVSSEQGSVRLQPNSLYVFIVNEPEGARLRIRGIQGCGNGVVEGAEQCDDGNSDSLDACTNTCNIGVPLPFGGSSSGNSSSIPPLPFGGSSSAGGVASSLASSVSVSSSASIFSSSSVSGDTSSASSVTGGAPPSPESSSSSSDAIASSSSADAAPFCGDGILNGTEECDDGNTVDNDECSNACLFLVPVPSFTQ